RIVSSSRLFMLLRFLFWLPPTCPLLPCTTLFRSGFERLHHHGHRQDVVAHTSVVACVCSSKDANFESFSAATPRGNVKHQPRDTTPRSPNGLRTRRQRAAAHTPRLRAGRPLELSGKPGACFSPIFFGRHLQRQRPPCNRHTGRCTQRTTWR